MATFTDSNGGNDYQYYGCNQNKAEQVATRFTFPSVPNGGNALVHTIGVRVGGALGENGRVRLAMWNSDGSGTAAASSELTVGGTTPSTAHTIKSQSVSKKVTGNTLYLIGFWRADSNCSYTTNFSFYNGSSRSIYFDNSAASPGTFAFSQTFDSSATLLFEIDYYYCPPAPNMGTATKGDGSASISFSGNAHAAADGGIDGYTVYAYDSAGTYQNISVDTTTSPVTVSGLTNGTAYKFVVSAYNSVGHGPATGYSNTITPSATPGTPTALSVTKGNAQASLTWTAPTGNGGSALTDYSIQYSTDNINWTTFSDGTSTTASAIVTGLTNGTLYYFKVAAINANGTGSYTSSGSATPSTTPSTPTGLTLTPSVSSIYATWVQPNNGGSAITDYIIQYSLDNINWITFTDGTSINISTTITGLSSSATLYYVKVAAINENGTGTYTSSVSTTTVTAVQPPSPPQNLITGSITTTQIPLSWSAPASNGGGSGITYKVSRDGIDIATALSTTSYVDTPGNTNVHTYLVYAKNTQNANYSSASNSINAKVLVAPTTAPTNFIATKLNYTTVQVSFSNLSIAEAVTGNILQYKKSTSSTWITSASTSIVFIDDASATYDYRVAAINSIGTGVYSSTINTFPDSISNNINLLSVSLRNAVPGVKFSIAPITRDVTSSPIMYYQVSKNGDTSYEDLSFGSLVPAYYSISSILLSRSSGTVVVTTSNNHAYSIGNKIHISGLSTAFSQTSGGTYGLSILNNARNGTQYYTITNTTLNTLTFNFDVTGAGLNNGTYTSGTHFLAYVMSYYRLDLENNYYSDILNGYSYSYCLKAVTLSGTSTSSNIIGLRTATPGLMTAYDSSMEIVANLPKRYNGSSFVNTQGVKYYDGSSWIYTKYPDPIIYGFESTSVDLLSLNISEVIDSGTPLTNYTLSDTIDFGGSFQ
jgi:hypothetical protein